MINVTFFSFFFLYLEIINIVIGNANKCCCCCCCSSLRSMAVLSSRAQERRIVVLVGTILPGNLSLRIMGWRVSR